MQAVQALAQACTRPFPPLPCPLPLCSTPGVHVSMPLVERRQLLPVHQLAQAGSHLAALRPLVACHAAPLQDRRRGRSGGTVTAASACFALHQSASARNSSSTTTSTYLLKCGRQRAAQPPFHGRLQLGLPTASLLGIPTPRDPRLGQRRMREASQRAALPLLLCHRVSPALEGARQGCVHPAAHCQLQLLGLQAAGHQGSAPGCRWGRASGVENENS